MTLADLITCAMATSLASWLLVSPDAHITETLRAKLTSGIVGKANAAEGALWADGDSRSVALRRWWWTWWTIRLGCRVCMGAEWAFLSWLILTAPWSRLNPLVWLMELFAVNGLHLALVKTTDRDPSTHGE